MSSVSALTDEQLAGFSVLARVCAQVFLNEPDAVVVNAVRKVAEALGDTRFDSVLPSAHLTQRYYDRFFVTNSPYFVPLFESSVQGAVLRDGRMQYAQVNGSATQHVQGCYRAVQFDFTRVECFELARKTLRPDAQAAELLFMATLAESAVSHQNSTTVRTRTKELLIQFALEHPVRWFGKAAECLGATDDDLYAHTATLVAQSVQAVFAKDETKKSKQ